MSQAARFEDRVIVVTGAARGIGREIARHFAREGARLVLGDIDADTLDATCTALRAEGASVEAVAGDLASEAGAQRLVDVASKAHGRIDVLVNNAGLWIIKPLEDTQVEEWDRQVGINLRALYLLCRCAIPSLRASGGGSIVNLASMAAIRFTVPHVAYAASKAGVVAFTRDLAVELAPDRVRVNAVAPGPIDTQGFVDGMNEVERERYLDGMLLGRVGTPADIADAVLFLASTQASYITGVTLPVTGGAELRIRPVM